MTNTTLTHLEQAYEFRRAMGQPIYTQSAATEDLQLRLIEEELGEFRQEVLRFGSPRDILKELADLVFVSYQFAAAKGWDLDEALDRVYESNMSKLVNGVPLRREDGKILKGPAYKAPDLSVLV